MSDFSKIIIDWYQSNKRDLPWRNTEDPFLIWVSEIILQQTRVAQGIDYYYRITEKFPDIKSLAGANEDDLLKLWQGLGYYSRARNMLKAARQLSEIHHNKFPEDYSEILKLSGIGKYTAAAISSFAFNLPHAVVDGNVYRVLSRVFGIDDPIDQEKSKRKFEALAQELLDTQRPGLHNQALMEIGALQCVPVNPDCSVCPLAPQCSALRLERINQLPLKSRRTTVLKKFFHYIYIFDQGYTLLYQRDDSSIWKKLWEFPMIETDHLLTDSEIFSDEFLLSVSKLTGYSVVDLHISGISQPLKHLLSHREILARFVNIEIKYNLSKEPPGQYFSNNTNFKRIPISEIDNYAIHRLMEKLLG